MYGRHCNVTKQLFVSESNCTACGQTDRQIGNETQADRGRLEDTNTQPRRRQTDNLEMISDEQLQQTDTQTHSHTDTHTDTAAYVCKTTVHVT